MECTCSSAFTVIAEAMEEIWSSMAILDVVTTIPVVYGEAREASTSSALDQDWTDEPSPLSEIGSTPSSVHSSRRSASRHSRRRTRTTPSSAPSTSRIRDSVASRRTRALVIALPTNGHTALDVQFQGADPKTVSVRATTRR